MIAPVGVVLLLPTTLSIIPSLVRTHTLNQICNACVCVHIVTWLVCMHRFCIVSDDEIVLVRGAMDASLLGNQYTSTDHTQLQYHHINTIHI